MNEELKKKFYEECTKEVGGNKLVNMTPNELLSWMDSNYKKWFRKEFNAMLEPFYEQLKPEHKLSESERNGRVVLLPQFDQGIKKILR